MSANMPKPMQATAQGAKAASVLADTRPLPAKQAAVKADQYERVAGQHRAFENDALGTGSDRKQNLSHFGSLDI